MQATQQQLSTQRASERAANAVIQVGGRQLWRRRGSAAHCFQASAVRWWVMQGGVDDAPWNPNRGQASL